MLTAQHREAGRLVRRAIALASRHADAGNEMASRLFWKTAARLSLQCGGRSGTVPGQDGHETIVLEDGLVAFSPLSRMPRSA